MDNKKSGILERLKHSVQLLASPAEVQLGLVPAFVCKADELALEFDHWWEVTRSNYSAILSADEQSALIATQQKVASLTENAKEEWTDQAVTNSPHWKEIRD